MFHVTQLRGFEKFCEGRPFYEMPNLMARICGICPVSHLIASAKACDAILAVSIPPTAAKLRRMLNLAQIIQSHALSFFYLFVAGSAAGHGRDPAERNLFGVVRRNPRVGRGWHPRCGNSGSRSSSCWAGRRIHPGWVVPGRRERAAFRGKARPDSHHDSRGAGHRRKRRWHGSRDDLRTFREEIRTFANFPTLFMGLVDAGRPPGLL